MKLYNTSIELESSWWYIWRGNSNIRDVQSKGHTFIERDNTNIKYVDHLFYNYKYYYEAVPQDAFVCNSARTPNGIDGRKCYKNLQDA